jgi:hypothetical protein
MVDPQSAFDLRKFPPDEKTRFVNVLMRGKNAMPPLGGLFGAEEIDALWAYVVAGEKRCPDLPVCGLTPTASSACMLACLGSVETAVERCRDQYCDEPAVESPYRKKTKLCVRTGASIGVEYGPDKRRYADENRDGQRETCERAEGPGGGARRTTRLP